MHLFFVTRGINHNRDVWLSHMQSQYFDWVRKNLNICECERSKAEHEDPACECKEFKPRTELTRVQGNLQPVELWSYVFPEESLPEVLTMMNMADGQGGDLNKNFSPTAMMLRKALGCEKVPNIPAVPTNKFIPFIGFGADPIGIKRDKRGEMYGYDQEGL